MTPPGAAQPIPIIDLKRQHASMKAELDEAVRRVLDSGWYISGGKFLAEVSGER